MSLLKKIRDQNPDYTQRDLDSYIFWHQNIDKLDNLVFDTLDSQQINETEADALKRLGKLDLLLKIKRDDHIINQFRRGEQDE